ncbi:unnamed protein product, partial [Mesorhabditis belari]|uniref:C-type lectin domain-containing protein n=1 Tax=Mesorhabditis belari TaxID=2138241 RepID=A0AAF3FRW5_9BILA
MLSQIILFVGYFGLIFGGSCPAGSVNYVEAGECIVTIPAPAPLSTASRTCAALSGRLIQPQTQQENVLAAVSAIKALPTKVPVTIGVIQRDRGVDRIYADGTPLQYLNFFSESEYSASPCTVLNPTNLQWYSTPCNDTHPFVCQFSDLSTMLCPTGWSWNDFTQNCYYVQNIVASNHALYVNQSDAEAICAQMGAHLASIHTQRENIWIRNFIATYGGVDCGQGGQALIGASCKDGKKTWSDGTTFDYDLTNGDCTDAYTMINDYNCGLAIREIWPSWYAQNQFSRFICQKAALHLADVAMNLVKTFQNI